MKTWIRFRREEMNAVTERQLCADADVQELRIEHDSDEKLDIHLYVATLDNKHRQCHSQPSLYVH